MNTIQVEILPDGMAKEVNSLGERPDITISYEDCTKKLCAEVSKGAMCHGVCSRKEESEEQWKLAESQRRVFKIAPPLIPVYIEGYRQDNLYCPNNNPLVRVEVGSIHTAEIVNEKGYIQL